MRLFADVQSSECRSNYGYGGWDRRDCIRERGGTDSQIILLYEAISVPDADALFLVLEYLPGGTLMEVHVGGDTSAAKPPFPREQAREYFRQLCLGLEYLHHNEVVHRDVSSFPASQLPISAFPSIPTDRETSF